MKKSIVLISIVSLFLTACGTSTQVQKVDSSKPIKIAVVGPHTGNFAVYGLSVVRAVQNIVDQKNNEGGIKGRRLELVVEDDRCILDTAYKKGLKIVRLGIKYVIGHLCNITTRTALVSSPVSSEFCSCPLCEDWDRLPFNNGIQAENGLRNP